MFTWQSISHKSVGGSTSGKFWLGFTTNLSIPLSDPPIYCPLSMMDLLEFAPKHIPVIMTEPLPHTSRISDLAPNSIHVDGWNCNGLFPFHLRQARPVVITPSPFVKSKWCTRSFTATEMSRFFDTPVAIERRLAKQYPTLLPALHPLTFSVPGKLLTHALWSTGYCTSQGGGDGIETFEP